MASGCFSLAAFTDSTNCCVSSRDRFRYSYILGVTLENGVYFFSEYAVKAVRNAVTVASTAREVMAIRDFLGARSPAFTPIVAKPPNSATITLNTTVVMVFVLCIDRAVVKRSNKR